MDVWWVKRIKFLFAVNFSTFWAKKEGAFYLIDYFYVVGMWYWCFDLGDVDGNKIRNRMIFEDEQQEAKL